MKKVLSSLTQPLLVSAEYSGALARYGEQVVL